MTPSAAPALRRRLACFVYDGVLLSGVVMAAGLVHGVVTQQHHAMQGRSGLRLTVFIVVGLYFILFWSTSGQTLAMKTWRIRVVRDDGRPLPAWLAALRYLAGWAWFVPGLVVLHFTGVHSIGAAALVLAGGVLAYAALAMLHPGRQYWHDALCRTRLIACTPPTR